MIRLLAILTVLMPMPMLCQCAFADGYSSLELRRHLRKAEAPDFLFARIEHPVKPGAELLTEAALDAGFSIIMLHPLPSLRIPLELRTMLGTDPERHLARISAEMGLELAEVEKVICAFPETNMQIRALFSGTMAPYQAYRDIDSLQYSFMEYSPTTMLEKGCSENVPAGVTIESITPLTLRGKRVPLTWLLETISLATGKTIRSETPLRGHFSMNLRQVKPELVLNLLMTLCGRIVIPRSQRFEVLIATPERIGIFDYGNIMVHPALEWLAFSREKLKNPDAQSSHPYIVSVLQRCIQLIMSEKFRKAEKMASSLLVHRKDLWEARYLKALALAGMSDFDAALKELRKIRDKIGNDKILSDVMQEIETLSKYPLVRSRVQFLQE
ncbi:MAG: hypothetical protein CVV64_16995 [Candidatus Wallbacteria bacterium HGW-Wallbacteria-1]|uniref:Tetratricopeptide repeat protein n=1 Tax=Candidatus Wallbacteria bacterium HGW-Wallbacteria-1 TaxID=2013854 RepID=A0A2N1PKI5_9BACT|nr:MAG: hypothetical protein CVV64_16995 [Candidatus Wallbacteria bacterium HGW-Wallbacteria-1]